MSNSLNIARETLKIKAFPNLQNKKLEIVQKIISSNKKPKPRINMTAKRLLQKQVIVSMNINSANYCGNHLSQWQMTTQGSKSLKMEYQVGNSQENSTRSLCLIRVLYIQNTYGPCYILISASFLTQGHYVVYICSDIIFQILLLHSRPMMSHHVTYHMTVMSCASSLSLKRKIKIKIKSKEK